MSFQSLFGFKCESKEPNVFHESFNIVGELLSQVLETGVCDCELAFQAVERD